VRVGDLYVEVLGERIVDRVVVAGRLESRLRASERLGEFVELVVFDARLLATSPSSSNTAICESRLWTSIPRVYMAASGVEVRGGSHTYSS